MKKIQKLFNKISQYQIGDLLEASEINQEILLLLQDEDLGLEETVVVGEVQQLFSNIVSSGLTQSGQQLLRELIQYIGSFSEKDKDGSTLDTREVGKEDEAVWISDLEVLTSFLEESVEHLDRIESMILQLENQFDPVAVNDIFRSMHTIKGVSSFLNLHQIKTVAHHLEYLLDDLRDGRLVLETAMIDLLFEGRDFLLNELGHIHEKVAHLTSQEKKKGLKNLSGILSAYP